MVGEFGREWVDMGNMQDGIDNAGACNPSDDPEGILTALHFRRLGFVIYPQPLRGDTSESPLPPLTPEQFQKNERLPAFALTNRQIKDVPDPPAPAPCVPLVTATNTGSGTVNLTLTTTNCTGMKGYRLYSAEGTAPLAFLHDLGAGTTFTDRRAKRGATHRYAATAYNDENIEGANSTEVSLAVTDTTSPATPVSVVGTAGDQFATVVWAPNWEDDLHGFNFYIATNAGGPFSKVNGTVINAALSPEWTQGGLANGQTYYIKVTAVDFSGNESAQSASVNVTPMP